MDAIIILTAAIAKYTAYAQRFATRIDTLTSERRELDRSVERLTKHLEDIAERKMTVRRYLKRTEKNTARYDESAGSLDVLDSREENARNKLTKLRKDITLNSAKIANAKKSLETSRRRVVENEEKLIEAKEEAAIKAAEAEAQRLKDEKVARKAARHAANRARHRKEKEARRRKNDTSVFRNDADIFPMEALRIADELGADLSNPDDRSAIMELIEHTQVA